MKWIVYFLLNLGSLVLLSGLFYGLSYHFLKHKSLVVLADNGKVQNAVSIGIGKGESKHEAKLNKIGATVSLSEGEKPSKIRIMSKEEMNIRFGTVLNAEPLKAKKIILYLNEYNTELNSKSKESMDLVIKTIEERTPCMVDIIGHTDTVGSRSKNIEVSLKRAKLVNRLIEKKGVDTSSFSIKGYGEEDLLIPTPNNTKEPRNRNVEVFIK